MLFGFCTFRHCWNRCQEPLSTVLLNFQISANLRSTRWSEISPTRTKSISNSSWKSSSEKVGTIQLNRNFYFSIFFSLNPFLSICLLFEFRSVPFLVFFYTFKFYFFYEIPKFNWIFSKTQIIIPKTFNLHPIPFCSNPILLKFVKIINGNTVFTHQNSRFRVIWVILISVYEEHMFVSVFFYFLLSLDN